MLIDINDFGKKIFTKYVKIDKSFLSELTQHIKALSNSEDLYNEEFNLLKDNSYVFDSIDSLIDFIKEVIISDLDENRKQSKEEGWENYFFFASYKSIKNTLLIVVNMYYPPNEFKRNILYNLVFVRTDGINYYLWHTHE